MSLYLSTLTSDSSTHLKISDPCFYLPMADTKDSSPPSSKRRFFLLCAFLAILYPIIRFLGFTVPRKPKIIQISTPLVAGGFHVGEDYILFDNGKEAWAISRRCTHLGCTINYHEKENIVECPCHQSRFTDTGQVVHGPAKRNLPRYKVEKLDDGGYIITV